MLSHKYWQVSNHTSIWCTHTKQWFCFKYRYNSFTIKGRYLPNSCLIFLAIMRKENLIDFCTKYFTWNLRFNKFLYRFVDTSFFCLIFGTWNEEFHRGYIICGAFRLTFRRMRGGAKRSCVYAVLSDVLNAPPLNAVVTFRQSCLLSSWRNHTGKHNMDYCCYLLFQTEVILFSAIGIGQPGDMFLGKLPGETYRFSPEF